MTSKAVNYLNTPVTQHRGRYTTGGPYMNFTFNGASHSERRSRPASVSTARKGDAHTSPTNWTHEGATATLPISSGHILPFGFPINWDWEVRYDILPNSSIAQVQVPSHGPNVNGLVNAAITSCLTKLKAQKVNLGVALAEAKEVAEMFRNTSKRVSKALEAAANRRPREWARGVRNAGSKNWKQVPSYYLEHVYGVVPFMSDLDGACQQLAETLNRGNTPGVTATAFSGDTDRYVDTYFDGQYGRYVAQLSRTTVARVGIRASAPSWVIQDYNSLGLENPISVVWERVPYSHVVDWFLPIGKWINTWDVGNHLQFETGFITRFTRSEGQILTAPPTGGALRFAVSDDLEGRYRGFRMDRSKLESFPMAEFPDLKNPLNLDHVAQGLAMLTNLLKGHKQLARSRS